MRTGTHAATAVLLVFAFAGSASAETIATLPFDFAKTEISDYEGNDFTIRDTSTNLEWKFPSGDRQFHQLLSRLDAAVKGNLAGFAYIGNGVGYTTDHAAWFAPMNEDGQPSAYPGKISARGARAFNPQTLSITKSGHGVLLTDGPATIAEVRNTEDDSALQHLRQLIQTHQLNVAWQIPSTYERTITPVGSAGPLVAFLKIDETSRPQARSDPIGVAGAIDHLAPAFAPVQLQRRPSPARSLSAAPAPARPASAPNAAPPEGVLKAPEVGERPATHDTTLSAEEEAASCNWWSPRCWSLKAKSRKAAQAGAQ